MSAIKITIIEDEEDIQHLLTYSLEKDGYSVTWFESGEDGLASLMAEPPDLVLLDLMSEGVNLIRTVISKISSFSRSQRLTMLES
jgi:DNA-binding response OmpR family regulator